jgi:exonuclease SbcD
MIRLLHIADVHPNAAATFAGKTVIDPATGLNQSLTDLQRSLKFVHDVATNPDTRCDALLIAGDVFDSVKPSMNEVRVMMEFLLPIVDEMPVIVIAGNHDISTNPNDATALSCLYGISNLFIAERPHTILLNIREQPVRFCLLPYPTKGRLLTQEIARDASPEQVTAMINQCLVDILRGFAAEFEPGVPRVLLAHGSVSNAKVGDQPRSLAHDILIPLDACETFDYVALGHIHQPQQVAHNAWYSGSLMRNGFGEEHEEKGFNIVELDVMRDVTFVENPHARRYRTIGVEHLNNHVAVLGLDASTVWRFKDQLNAGDYQELKPLLDQLQAATPFMQLDVELLHEDRTRDAGMAACPTMEQALARALTGSVDKAELPALFEKHQALLMEVNA